MAKQIAWNQLILMRLKWVSPAERKKNCRSICCDCCFFLCAHCLFYRLIIPRLFHSTRVFNCSIRRNGNKNIELNCYGGKRQTLQITVFLFIVCISIAVTFYFAFPWIMMVWSCWRKTNSSLMQYLLLLSNSFHWNEGMKRTVLWKTKKTKKKKVCFFFRFVLIFRLKQGEWNHWMV